MTNSIIKPVIQPLTPADTQSANIIDGNLAQLKTLFPEAFKEGGVDFEVLKQLLGGHIDEREEKYGLNWHGKRRARQIALTPSTGTLRPCPGESVDWDTTQNLMIEGDNLEVLKLLQKSYAGKVKMIYIDPPYNTGKDFVYPDNFTDNIKNYLELTGQTDGEGRKLSSNTEASGRFHTDWLNMMYPRLKLARNLLREDGVIFISIDENELDNLVQIGNQIFGEENLVGLIAAQLNPRGRHLDRFLARTHEYLCVFAKDAESNALYSVAKDERMAAEYRKEDSRGKFRDLELRNRNPAFNRVTRPNLYYPIYVCPTDGSVAVERSEQNTIEVFPKNSEGGDSCWTWGKEKLATDKNIVAGRQVADGGWRIYRKDYLVDEDGKSAMTLPKALWIDKSLNNDLGKKAIQELFDKTIFDFPKSPAFVEKIIEIGSESNDLIVDFFAGSGTTGQAVMTQNSADNGTRRYILVQLPEPLDAENKDQKVAAEFCNSIGKPRNIAELTKERLRRAATKIGAARAHNNLATAQLSLENEPKTPKKPLDLGFKVFKLDTSNIRAWNPNPDELADTLMAHTEHLAAGRSEADVLYEVLLKQGLDLALPVQHQVIAGHAVYSVGAGALLVCLARAVNEAADFKSADAESIKAMSESTVTPANAEALALGMANWHTQLAAALGQTSAELHTRVVLRDSLFGPADQADVAKTNLTAILRQRGLEDVRSL